MRTILLASILFCSPVFAEDVETDFSRNMKGIFDMAEAYQYGQMRNQLAAEAPPIRYQIETINKNPAPNYYFGGAAPSGDSLGNLIKGLEAANQAEVSDSPFNDAFMPGVE